MKTLILFLCILFLVGCGNDKIINGKLYETVGLFNSEEKAPEIQYKIIKGNVIWSIILVETVVFPVYFIGFSLYEPVGLKG